MSKSWFKIQNKAKGKARIDIYEEIGYWGITAKRFIEDLNALDVSEIDLHISSGGGDVIDGWAIYYNLKAHKAKVNVYIDGIAASMATIIALAGETIEIVENGWFMIHNPAGGSFGESDDIRKLADILDKMKEQTVALYASKTGIDADEISAMMDAETWMDGKEALAKGFVDTIGHPVAAVACANPQRFLNAPRSLVEPPETPQPQPKKQEKSMPIDKAALVNRGIATATASEEDALIALDTFVNAAKHDKNALSEAQNSIQNLETEKTELQAKLDAAETSASEAKAQAAVDGGKIDAKQKDAYLALLKADPQNAEAFLANMAAPAAPGRAPIKASAPAQPGGKDGGEMNRTERILAKKAQTAQTQ